MNIPPKDAKSMKNPSKAPANNAAAESSANAKRTFRAVGGAVKRAGKRISDAGK